VKARPILEQTQHALGDAYSILAMYSAQGMHAASEHLGLAQQAISAHIHSMIYTANGA
jgi:hypothetical protein